eukprot:4237183-Pleurochrysis_carterae.AAC.1
MLVLAFRAPCAPSRTLAGGARGGGGASALPSPAQACCSFCRRLLPPLPSCASVAPRSAGKSCGAASFLRRSSSRGRSRSSASLRSWAGLALGPGGAALANVAVNAVGLPHASGYGRGAADAQYRRERRT